MQVDETTLLAVIFGELEIPPTKESKLQMIQTRKSTFRLGDRGILLKTRLVLLVPGLVPGLGHDERFPATPPAEWKWDECIGALRMSVGYNTEETAVNVLNEGKWPYWLEICLGCSIS